MEGPLACLHSRKSASAAQAGASNGGIEPDSSSYTSRANGEHIGKHSKQQLGAAEKPGASCLDPQRHFLYDRAWHSAWLFKPDRNQRPARIGDAAACMVGRPWPRADLRLDWQLRAGHWVLFSALARSIFRPDAALLAGALDLGRGAALGREHPRLGVAHFAAGFRGLRIDRGRDFSA